jgi:hypothetical protein
VARAMASDGRAEEAEVATSERHDTV